MDFNFDHPSIYSKEQHPVLNKFDGKVISTIPLINLQRIQDIFSLAERGYKENQRICSNKRSKALHWVFQQIKKHSEELSFLYCQETGKSLYFAQKDLSVAAQSFELASHLCSLNLNNLFLSGQMDNNQSPSVFYQFQPKGIINILPKCFSPLLSAIVKVAVSLAFGNSVLLPLYTHSPLTMIRITNWINQSGFSPLSILALPIKEEALFVNPILNNEKYRTLFVCDPCKPPLSLLINKQKEIIKHSSSVVGVFIGKDSSFKENLSSYLNYWLFHYWYENPCPFFLFISASMEKVISESLKDVLSSNMSQFILNNKAFLSSDLVDRIKQNTTLLLSQAMDKGYILDYLYRSEHWNIPVLKGSVRQSPVNITKAAFSPVFFLLTYRNLKEVLFYNQNQAELMELMICTKDRKETIKLVENFSFSHVAINSFLPLERDLIELKSALESPGNPLDHSFFAPYLQRNMIKMDGE